MTLWPSSQGFLANRLRFTRMADMYFHLHARAKRTSAARSLEERGCSVVGDGFIVNYLPTSRLEARVAGVSRRIAAETLLFLGSADEMPYSETAATANRVATTAAWCLHTPPNATRPAQVVPSSPSGGVIGGRARRERAASPTSPNDKGMILSGSLRSCKETVQTKVSPRGTRVNETGDRQEKTRCRSTRARGFLGAMANGGPDLEMSSIRTAPALPTPLDGYSLEALCSPEQADSGDGPRPHAKTQKWAALVIGRAIFAHQTRRRLQLSFQVWRANTNTTNREAGSVEHNKAATPAIEDSNPFPRCRRWRRRELNVTERLPEKISRLYRARRTWSTLGKPAKAMTKRPDPRPQWR
ncbi:hypothetical protein FI667_g312, partial [Globisporangium splendens]